MDWQQIAEQTPAKIEAAAAGQTPDVAPLGGETDPVDSVARCEPGRCSAVGPAVPMWDRFPPCGISLPYVGPASQPVSGSLKGFALARHEKRDAVCLMI